MTEVEEADHPAWSRPQVVSCSGVAAILGVATLTGKGPTAKGCFEILTVVACTIDDYRQSDEHPVEVPHFVSFRQA